MGKKIIVTESQLKRLIQHQAKMKLNEGMSFDDNTSTDEMLANDELDLDVEDGQFVDDTMEMGIDAMEMGVEDDTISLNEGKLKLKDTFNKYMSNPIIDSLSSQVKK
jgi:hypothetical protein